MLSVHVYLFLISLLFYRFWVMKVFVAVLLVAMVAGKCAIFQCNKRYCLNNHHKSHNKMLCLYLFSKFTLFTYFMFKPHIMRKSICCSVLRQEAVRVYAGVEADVRPGRSYLWQPLRTEMRVCTQICAFFLS